MHHKDLKYRVQKEKIGILKYLNSQKELTAPLKAAFSTASLMLCDSCCLVTGDWGVKEFRDEWSIMEN